MSARTVHDLTSADASPSAVPLPPSRWKTRVLLPATLLAGTLGLFVAVSWDRLWPAIPVRVEPTVGKRVEGAVGEATVQAAGWLEPYPYPTYVPSLVPGVVEEVLVLEGDQVEAGQVVARLVDEEVLLKVAEAKAELGEARALHAVAEADLASAVETNRLLIDRKRDTQLQAARVAEIQASLAELESRVASHERKVALAKDEWERNRPLVASGAVSEGVVVQLELKLESARADLEATRRREAVLQANLEQARAESLAAQRHAEALIEETRAEAVAKAALARAKARVDRAAAKLGSAELELERHEVKAMTSGIVLRRLVAPGSMLMFEGVDMHAGHVLHLYDPSQLEVRVDVPLADAAQVGHGQKAQVTVEALPDRVFTGQVVRVVHEADLQKNTVEFKVKIDDPVETLKPEMLARVRFLAPADDRAEGQLRLFAPRSALVGASDTSARVWVVSQRRGARARARLREVSLGTERTGDAVEVRSGLQVGDELIVAPPTNLTDGAWVTVGGAQ